jgi:hypothetical protein
MKLSCILQAKYLSKKTAAGSVDGVKALDDVFTQLAVRKQIYTGRGQISRCLNDKVKIFCWKYGST